LKALRESAGLSQQGLADRAGCNKFTVTKLEAAKQEPAWPLVLAICRALGVTCQALADCGACRAEEAPWTTAEGRRAVS
jgi:DNA-binding XRE family transcriptional regulator